MSPRVLDAGATRPVAQAVEGTPERARGRRPGRPWGRWAALLLALAAVVGAMAWLGHHGGAGQSGLRSRDAVVLGLVEGVTEYLPVSSTGHLSLAERLLGVGGSPEREAAVDSYVVVVQGGAILAVAWLYRRRLLRLARGVIGRDAGGRHLLATLVVATAPAAAVGLLVRGVVQDRLFSPGPIALAWLLGGAFILGWSRWPRRPGSCALDQATMRQALVVGLAQTVALWPGTSRSLVTILAGCLVGLLTDGVRATYTVLAGSPPV